MKRRRNSKWKWYEPPCRELNPSEWITIGYCLKMNIRTGERRRYCIICGNYYDAVYSTCTYCLTYKLLEHAGKAGFLLFLFLLGWLYS